MNVNMGSMGGPVGGGPLPMMNNSAMAAHGAARQMQMNSVANQAVAQDYRTMLNTYIYEYFLRFGMYDCARSLLDSPDAKINVKPNGQRDEHGNPIGNGDVMDAEIKDEDGKQNFPEPAMGTHVPEDSSFLYEWFCLFFDMFEAQKGKAANPHINQFVAQAQVNAVRTRHAETQQMLRQMRAGSEFAQQQHQRMMMNQMNANLNMAIKPGNQLQRTAMANSQGPNMMLPQKAGQMQRDPSSDMDGSRGRPASPGGAENAQSPSKRPRLGDGPSISQVGMMPNGGRPGGMPGQNQHHGTQMPNKPNVSGPPSQGSHMTPQGSEGNSIGPFFSSDMGQSQMRGASNGQNGAANSNHALQDYQMQLMLLEQQNKKRLMMARQEHEVNTTAGGMARNDGPVPQGPSQQFQQGTSPPGGRPGASPNPAEQMKRANPQMNNAANMGSPLAEGGQSRSSPVNFMQGQPELANAPHFYKGINPGMDMSMVNAQMNGGMRPPSSHPGQPPFQMAAQMMSARQPQPGGPGGLVQWQGPNGQMGPQGAQPGMQGTPRQCAMPPPSAPAPANANVRNATASPQITSAAPPTPQQGSKPAPKKKDTKNSKSKAASQKKSNLNLNSAPTPSADAAVVPESPAPATPMTPAISGGFVKAGPNQVPPVVANTQPAAPPPPPPAAINPPSHTGPAQNGGFDQGATAPFDVGENFEISFAHPMNSADLLDNFDFDSFLHNDDGAESAPFNGSFSAFGMEEGMTGSD